MQGEVRGSTGEWWVTVGEMVERAGKLEEFRQRLLKLGADELVVSAYLAVQQTYLHGENFKGQNLLIRLPESTVFLNRNNLASLLDVLVELEIVND